MERRRHYIYPDMDTLVAAFVCEVNQFLREASLAERPHYLALSGGSTPLAVFNRLREETRKEDWSNVHLYWVDERCVGPEHNESNFGNASRLFIEPLGLPRDQVHRIRGEEQPDLEAQRYGRQLMNRLPLELGLPVFDWIWLGLGNDGHTASIFPDQIHLMNSTEPCAVAVHPGTGQQRITLTGNVLNAARRVSFIVTGASKSPIVNKIVMKEGDYMDFPAFYVTPNSENLEWFFDQEATSWL